MGLPLFESCCFCIPLQTGTLVLGYLHLVFSLIGIAVSVFIVIGGAVLTSGVVDLKGKHFVNENETLTNEEAVEIAGAFTWAIGIILLILCITKLIFVIFLLVGGHSGKPGHIKAYLVYSVIMLVITVILIIVCLAAAPFALVISPFITCVIEIYFLLVIRSYMIKLQDNPEGDRADNRKLYTQETL